jgi:hypothetical protein
MGTPNLENPLPFSGSDITPHHSDSAYFKKIMASILIKCVEVNFATGYQLNLPLQVGCINSAGRIRERADKLMEYDYQKAIQVIQLDNALATDRTLQRR